MQRRSYLSSVEKHVSDKILKRTAAILTVSLLTWLALGYALHPMAKGVVRNGILSNLRAEIANHSHIAGIEITGRPRQFADLRVTGIGTPYPSNRGEIVTEFIEKSETK